MPFKDLPQGTTQYLDEDGNLVGGLSPEELEKFNALLMNAPLDEPKEDIDIENYTLVCFPPPTSYDDVVDRQYIIDGDGDALRERKKKNASSSNTFCMADIYQTYKFPIIINGKKFGDGELKMNITTKEIALEIKNPTLSILDEAFFGKEAPNERRKT